MSLSPVSYPKTTGGFTRKINMNSYLNECNYFNKSTIKLALYKQKYLNNLKEKKNKDKQKQKLPKLIYSNPVFSLNNALNPINDYDIKKEIFNKPVPYNNNNRYKADFIEDLLNNPNAPINKEKMVKSHANKKFDLFDDIFNTVDNLQLNNSEGNNKNNEENDFLPDYYLKSLTQDNSKEIINNNNENETEEKKKSLSVIDENEEKNKNINNNNNEINDNVMITIQNKENKDSMSNTFTSPEAQINTVLSNSDLIKKILSENRNYKNTLQFTDYGKYKYTQKGLNYPYDIESKNLPSYVGNDSRDKSYFDYRKKASNTNQIYNNIGSFGNKFNRELARISRSYGKEESKARFVQNPVLKKYHDQIPYYNLYKDLKFVENKYLEKGRYKFKLLPLINTKLRNFDRLGNKVYQMSINKRNQTLKLETIKLK
jgi:hypothetical protein